MTKNLYKMHVNCGRMGDLEGLFIAEDKEVQNILGQEIHFGEVLGKHSDVWVIMEEQHFKLVSDDQDKVSWLMNLLGETVSGYNPWSYMEEDEDE